MTKELLGVSIAILSIGLTMFLLVRLVLLKIDRDIARGPSFRNWFF